MKEYKTYIFDLDGTLLSTLGDLAASTNYALRTNGMPERTLDEVRRFVGNGVKKLIERAVPDGIDNPLFDKTFETFKESGEIMLTHLENSKTMEETHEKIPELIKYLI